jgi:hypothetical protein
MLILPVIDPALSISFLRLCAVLPDIKKQANFLLYLEAILGL